MLLLLPIPGSAIALAGGSQVVATATPGVYLTLPKADWVYNVSKCTHSQPKRIDGMVVHLQAVNVSTLVYCTVTSAVSFTLEIRTLFAYRRLSELTQRRHIEDYRLLRKQLQNVYALSAII